MFEIIFWLLVIGVLYDVCAYISTGSKPEYLDPIVFSCKKYDTNGLPSEAYLAKYVANLKEKDYPKDLPYDLQEIRKLSKRNITMSRKIRRDCIRKLLYEYKNWLSYPYKIRPRQMIREILKDFNF